jgi:dTMP kinase
MVFVVIDGLDGSGKSTQARLICERAAEKGRTFVLRAHPSPDSFFGRLARGCLLLEGRRAHAAASLLYLLDVARSLLVYGWRRVDYLVFVRYLMGTAYLPEPLHTVAYLFFYRVVPRSSHMYFIDVSPEEAYRRIEAGRSRREMFESPERLRRVRGRALSLTSVGPWRVIDGDRHWRVVHRQLAELIGL